MESPATRLERVLLGVLIALVFLTAISISDGMIVIFDEDFNDALVKIMKKGQGGQIYHFSTNKFYTINQIIKIVCNFKGVNYKDVIYRVPDRKGKDKFYFLNCKKTSKKLNWKPKNDLFKGILKTIKYYDNK